MLTISETSSRLALPAGRSMLVGADFVPRFVCCVSFSIRKSPRTSTRLGCDPAAFAAGDEAQLTGRLTACAGSCGPGSLHFINGLYEASRNRAPVILIASQIVRRDLGFDSVQEVDLAEVYKGCSVFSEMILTPEQARRKTVAACQAALTRRGVAVLVVPVDIANAAAHDELPYTVHARQPLVRPSDADLDEIAAVID
jgi:pyruvate dehydrogenase (quinone)